LSQEIRCVEKILKNLLYLY